MNILLLLTLIPALLFSSAPAGADTPTATVSTIGLHQLAWLAGHWCGGVEGRITEELWLPPAGGLMLGLNRDVGPDGKTFYEYLRLQQTDDDIFYRASPKGGKTTSFKLVESKPDKAVFENRAHDFPQRITYRLAATHTLEVTIEGNVDGRAESRSWSWSRLSGVAAATGGGDQ